MPRKPMLNTMRSGVLTGRSMNGRKRYPIVRLLLALLLPAALSACDKKDPAGPQRPAPTVSVLTVASRDVPVSFQYVAQTQSSRLVNIQARVNGFLDRRVYTEGAVVKAGAVLFQMDPKPFQAQLDAAKAALANSQAASDVAKANLARVQPLVARSAMSQTDLDNAIGNQKTTAAAVEQAKAQLQTAALNLSYCTITSPINGITSAALQADGSYISTQNSQLTTVSVLSPMWVNFSLSENEFLNYRTQTQEGQLRPPPNNQWRVEIVLGDGSVFPAGGAITFSDPSFNSQTGTFLIRAQVDNPQGLLRPNQYVRARVTGAIRPAAILVPQRSVLQGAKGHFVWVIDHDNKAESRPVNVGDWNGEDWFISDGLRPGERVVVEGGNKLSAGMVVDAKPSSGQPAAAATTKPSLESSK